MEYRVERAEDFARVKQIYKTRLTRDFIRAERKPLSAIHRLWEKGAYGAYFLMGGDETLGYAFFVRSGRNCLFDYFAIAEGHRDEGLGTIFLRMLAECFPGTDCILGEVEDPERAATDEERQLRERRVEFYRRSGYRITDVKATVFGVEFRLVEVPVGREHSDEELREIYTELYRLIFPPLIFRTQVRVGEK